MNVYEIMQRFRPGSQDWTWEEEFDEIDERLLNDPIKLGTDGRVIDGHHRIRLAYALKLVNNLPYEVVNMEEEKDD